MNAPSKPSNSAQTIASCLRGYSASIEFWAPDMAETAGDAGFRRRLHDLLDAMTAAQRAQLASLDARAAELFAKHNGQPDPYFDIAALGDMIAIAKSERSTP